MQILLVLYTFALVAASAASLQIDHWIAGPLTTGMDCVCPGVRIARNDSDCVCFNLGPYNVSLPNTLLGALLPQLHFDPLFGFNLNSISPTPFFRQQWWLNASFELPASASQFTHLELEGINYRADVWVNDFQVANSTSIVGPFRQFFVDISAAAKAGRNEINILLTPSVDHTFPPSSNSTDLSITFVDWNPEPPDRSMGILQPVRVVQRAVAAVATPVKSNISFTSDGTFNASLHTVVRALRATAGGAVRLNVTLVTGQSFSHVTPIPALSANERFVVRVQPEDVTWLRAIGPEHLWNPWQMGPATLHLVSVEYLLGSVALTLQNHSVGFRLATASLDASGSLQLFVNRKPVQVRGGGWAPDMFLRANDTRLRMELELVRHMNLNAIRLEGKFMWEGFFEATDRAGLLVLPGWCCCDSWQHWEYWGAEQYTIAAASLATQVNQLAPHPSVVAFFYSSDQLPPPNVEMMYLEVFQTEAWPNPTISSASAAPSTITGPTGVKMSGPYAWVPPNYWLEDSSPQLQNLGGAWGFLTEGGPGASPLTLASWNLTVSKADLWPESGLLSESFSFHCANPMGLFRDMRYFVPALEARYGSSKTVSAALFRSQAATYEAIRAMFEGYSMRKLVGATGVVQWMMNNAWPSNMWHLFDFYLAGGGGFYGAKKACEPLHVMVSYADWSVTAINSMFEHLDFAPSLNVTAELVSLQGNRLWRAETALVSIAENGVHTLPELQLPPLQTLLRENQTALLRLRWQGALEGTNDYWVTQPMDVINWTDSNFYRTGVARFANFSELSQVPASVHIVREDWSTDIRGGSNISVTVVNIGTTVAPIVALTLSTPQGSPINPALCSANFVALLPHESRDITCWTPWWRGDGVVAVESYFSVVTA